MADASEKEDFMQSTDNDVQTLPSSASTADPTVWRCDICNIGFKNDAVLRSDHLAGKRHKSNMTLKFLPAHKYWCDACKVQCLDSVNMEQHCKGKMHKAKMDVQHAKLFSYFERKLGQVFLCELCGIKFDTSTSLLEHYDGNEHKKNEAQIIGNAGEDEKMGGMGEGIDVSDSQEIAKGDKGKGIGIDDSQERAEGDKGKRIDVGDSQEKAKGAKFLIDKLGQIIEKRNVMQLNAHKCVNASDAEKRIRTLMDCNGPQLVIDKLRQIIQNRRIMQPNAEEHYIGDDTQGSAEEEEEEKIFYWCHHCNVMVTLLELIEHEYEEEHKARVAKSTGGIATSGSEPKTD